MKVFSQFDAPRQRSPRRRGTFAVIIGLCFAGIGVLPIGILAALFHAKWSALFELIMLTILTFGSRLFALWLAAKIDAEAERIATAAYLS